MILLVVFSLVYCNCPLQCMDSALFGSNIRMLTINGNVGIGFDLARLPLGTILLLLTCLRFYASHHHFVRSCSWAGKWDLMQLMMSWR